jgi:hypothetical protein
MTPEQKATEARQQVVIALVVIVGIVGVLAVCIGVRLSGRS